MGKSETPQRQDNTTKDANQSKNKAADTKGVATTTKDTPARDKGDIPENAKNPSKVMVWMKKHITPTLVIELLVFIVGCRVAWIYSGQLTQMIESNKISREALQI